MAVTTADKSNELTALPELHKVLEIEGCSVTIDAMGCRKPIACQISLPEPALDR